MCIFTVRDVQKQTEKKKERKRNRQILVFFIIDYV